MEEKLKQAARRVGVILCDPLRLLGLESILFEQAGLIVVPVTVSGALHSFEIKLLIMETAAITELSETLQIIRRQRPDLKVVILGPPKDTALIQQTIGAGAKGYLNFDAKESEICQCMDVVMDGSIWAPRKVLARLIEAGTNASGTSQTDSRFTGREEQVLSLLIEGRPNRDIALALHIDEGTVKAHVSRLMRKVGVGNRTALTMYVLHQSSLARAN